MYLVKMFLAAIFNVSVYSTQMYIFTSKNNVFLPFNTKKKLKLTFNANFVSTVEGLIVKDFMLRVGVFLQTRSLQTFGESLEDLPVCCSIMMYPETQTLVKFLRTEFSASNRLSNNAFQTLKVLEME